MPITVLSGDSPREIRKIDCRKSPRSRPREPNHKCRRYAWTKTTTKTASPATQAARRFMSSTRRDTALSYQGPVRRAAFAGPSSVAESQQLLRRHLRPHVGTLRHRVRRSAEHAEDPPAHQLIVLAQHDGH